MKRTNKCGVGDKCHLLMVDYTSARSSLNELQSADMTAIRGRERGRLTAESENLAHPGAQEASTSQRLS